MIKRCSKCKLDKPFSSFSPQKERKDGLKSVCKDCRNAAHKLSRYSNIENTIYITAKSRAKRCNIEFNIDVTDIIIPEYCPLLGIKLEKSSDKHSPNLYSLDRLDNTKGYVRGNIHVISFRANKLKNDASLKEFKLIATNWEKLLNE